jgi:hypothetical protein
MPVPSFQELIEPAFEALKDLGGEAHIRDIENRVAEKIKLTEDDLQVIHDGGRTKFNYNLAWARTYLKLANIIERLNRGFWKIKEDKIEISINAQEILSVVRALRSDDELEKEDINSDLGDLTETDSENPNVEKEMGPSPVIEEPFNPKLIDIRVEQITIQSILYRLQDKSINLFTDFQRQSDLWDISKQSKLIESILLRFPLPAFYFDCSNDDEWLVVDGLQRLSSLRNFIVDGKYKGQEFRLNNLDFLHQFEGATYQELPGDLKRRLSEVNITIYKISQGTPDLVKFILFKRINTGGLTLEAQEIRHALNQGAASRLVKDLADTEEFKKATCYTIKKERMADRDFTTRFLSFYLINFNEYTPDLDAFMNKGMAIVNNKATVIDTCQVMNDFVKGMKAAYDIFGNDAFRKRYRSSDYRKPINKAMFEVWSVTLAKMHSEDIAFLVKFRTDLIKAQMDLFNTDSDFANSLSSGTGEKGRVIKRFKTIEKLVHDFLNT